MIDRKRRGWFDSGDLARAIHRLNVVGGFEASALRGLMARYTSGSGRVTLSHFVGENGLGAAEDYPDGGFKLGGNSYEPVRAKTPPRFPKRLDASELEKVAREKFASKVPAGWSRPNPKPGEARPGPLPVTLVGLRLAPRRVYIGLGAVTAEDTRNLFQRIKGDDRVGEGDASASPPPPLRLPSLTPPSVTLTRPTTRAGSGAPGRRLLCGCSRRLRVRRRARGGRGSARCSRRAGGRRRGRRVLSPSCGCAGHRRVRRDGRWRGRWRSLTRR